MKTLHPIESFGLLKVSLSGIRVEKIKDRINPAVPFPHKHDFYQLMIIQSGSGWHQIDFKKFLIKKDQLYIMKPGQIHTWSLDSKIRGYIIEFNIESLHNEIKENTSLKNKLDSSPDLLEDITELLVITKLMFKEFQDQEPFYDISLRNLLSTMIVLIARKDVGNKKESKTNTIIENFKGLMEENFMNEHGVEFYAKALSISSKALAMQVSRATGKAPRTMIQDRIILEAKRLLAFSQQSVSEISYRLGFFDTNYFTRFFKAHTKMTPMEFRKKTTPHGS